MGSLTFYFDVCFGKRLPETILRARPPFGVEYHGNRNNRFKQDTPDDKWLSIVGAKGWIVFSHDRRFHNESTSIEAIKQHRIGCFYLPGASLGTWDKLFMFFRAHHRIIEIAKYTEKPFVYYVTNLNKVEKIEII